VNIFLKKKAIEQKSIPLLFNDGKTKGKLRVGNEL
jgi:hypothetical protein